MNDVQTFREEPEDCKLLYQFESAVLLRSKNEAETLYRSLLEKEVISKETRDELNQECCEFFTNPGNDQLLYPIQNVIRPLIPQTYYVENLYPHKRKYIEEQLSPKRNEFKGIDEDTQMPELLQYESDKEHDLIEAEDLLDEREYYKCLHGLQNGVLLQSSTEAENLLRLVLQEKVISKEKRLPRRRHPPALNQRTGLKRAPRVRRQATQRRTTRPKIRVMTKWRNLMQAPLARPPPPQTKKGRTRRKPVSL
jgi:hypothetical protein